MNGVLTQSVIADIRARHPNTYTDAQLINWINSAIEEVWDELAFEEVAGIELKNGERTYALPEDCSFFAIRSVVVGRIAYTPRDLPDNIIPYSYSKLVENTTTINPAPVDGEMYITYRKKPRKVLAITDELDIRPETVEVVKNAVLAVLAKANGEVQLANNYLADYNAALALAKEKKALHSGTFPKVKEVQP